MTSQLFHAPVFINSFILPLPEMLSTFCTPSPVPHSHVVPPSTTASIRTYDQMTSFGLGTVIKLSFNHMSIWKEEITELQFFTTT